MYNIVYNMALYYLFSLHRDMLLYAPSSPSAPKSARAL